MNSDIAKQRLSQRIEDHTMWIALDTTVFYSQSEHMFLLLKEDPTTEDFEGQQVTQHWTKYL